MGSCCCDPSLVSVRESILYRIKSRWYRVIHWFEYHFCKSGTYKKAKEEFNYLRKSWDGKNPDAMPVVLEFEKEILALVEKFGKSGQSGGSAPYYSKIISSTVKSLCMHEPIAGITGEDWEWDDVTKWGDGSISYQNKRLSSVFKDGTDSKAHYLDAIVFKGQNGSCFTSSRVDLADGSYIGSAQYIKSFPFEPKTFYIDVIETEWADKEEKVEKAGGGWWTAVVKDESQLKEVFEYYDRKVKK